MATRQKSRQEPEYLDEEEAGRLVPIQQGGNGELQVPEDTEQTPAERLASMLESASGIERAVVRVYRLGDKPGQMDWCENYPVADFEAGGDLKLIRSEFGAGRYSIRIFGPIGHGQKQGLMSRLDVGIVADPRPKENPAPVHQANGELAQVLQSMAETQRVILERLSTPAPVVDPMAQMANTFSMMKLMREAMGPPPAAAPQKTLVEQLTELRALQQVAGELAPKGEGSGNDEPSLLGLGAQVLGLVQQAQERGAAPLVPAIAPPGALAHPPFPPLHPAAEVPQTMPAPLDSPQPRPNVSFGMGGAVSVPGAAVVEGGGGEPHLPDLQANGLPSLDLTTLPPEAQSEIAALRALLDEAIALEGKPDVRDPEFGVMLTAAEQAATLLYDKLPDEAMEMLWHEQWFAGLCQFAPNAAAHESFLRDVHSFMAQWAEEDEAAANSDASTVIASTNQNIPVDSKT